jgi:hypothetical protein
MSAIVWQVVETERTARIACARLGGRRLSDCLGWRVRRDVGGRGAEGKARARSGLLFESRIEVIGPRLCAGLWLCPAHRGLGFWLLRDCRAHVCTVGH